jgi:hypothetical protein
VGVWVDRVVVWFAQGEWKEDKKNGKGVFMWANGDRYEGEWKDDKPNGRGVKTWAKGDRCVPPLSLSLSLSRPHI